MRQPSRVPIHTDGNLIFETFSPVGGQLGIRTTTARVEHGRLLQCDGPEDCNGILQGYDAQTLAPQFASDPKPHQMRPRRGWRWSFIEMLPRLPARRATSATLRGMARLIVMVVLAITGSRADAATVNRVLGDVSFVEAFGRAPHIGDDDNTRIRIHLHYVLERLQRSPRRSIARTHSLALLAEYIARGEFPRDDGGTGRRPTFIDDQGRICAVGYLIERTVGRDVAEAIARHANHAYLPDLASPALVAWAASVGLDLDELAMIQPTYRCRTVRRDEWEPAPTPFLGDPVNHRSSVAVTMSQPIDNAHQSLAARLQLAGALRAGLVLGILGEATAESGPDNLRRGARGGALAGWIGRSYGLFAHADFVTRQYGGVAGMGLPLRPGDADAAVFAVSAVTGTGELCRPARCLARIDAALSSSDGSRSSRIGGQLVYQLPMVALGLEATRWSVRETTTRPMVAVAATVRYTARRGWGMSPWILQLVRPGLAVVATVDDGRRGFGVLFDLEVPLGRAQPFYEDDKVPSVPT